MLFTDDTYGIYILKYLFVDIYTDIEQANQNKLLGCIRMC